MTVIFALTLVLCTVEQPLGDCRTLDDIARFRTLEMCLGDAIHVLNEVRKDGETAIYASCKRHALVGLH